MMEGMDQRLQVFFDGACPICTREVRHYSRRDRDNQIKWIDIAAPAFKAADYGLDPAAIHKAMHARTAEGRVYAGVDAFIQIWRAIPHSFFASFALLLLRIPGMMSIARLFYHWFARNRYRLTGRCTPEGCAIHPEK